MTNGGSWMIAMATAIRQLDGDYAFRYNVNKTE